MEEIQEINQEIEMKKSAVHNRMDLLRRILQKSENAETRIAIESFLLKIEHENNLPSILMDNNRENSEEVKEQEPSEKSKVEEEPSTSEQTNDQENKAEVDGN